MVRPCFLIVDREFPGSISTRKLVIETAKFNVITAYSGQEALETLKRFPNLHGIVLDTDLQDVPCAELVEGFRKIQPKIFVLAISGPRQSVCEGADQHLESFDPRRLLEVLRTLQPVAVEKIEEHEEKLSRDLS